MNPTEPIRVLIVEDDLSIGKEIAEILNSANFLCDISASGLDAIEKVRQEEFPLVFVDLALRDDSGLGVLRCLREANPEAGLIVLTPIDYRDERIMAFEAGAEDFIIKPFAKREILARAEAAVVRSRSKPKKVLVAGPLSLDLSMRRASRDGKQLTLTPTELRILEILMMNVNKVVTRRMLCEFLWNPDWEGVTNVIEVHINRLRRKVEKPETPQLIRTVRGSGYSLRPVAAASGPATPMQQVSGQQASSQV